MELGAIEKDAQRFLLSIPDTLQARCLQLWAPHQYNTIAKVYERSCGSSRPQQQGW